MLEVTVRFKNGDVVVHKKVDDVVVYPNKDRNTGAYVSIMRKLYEGRNSYEIVYEKPESVLIRQE